VLLYRPIGHYEVNYANFSDFQQLYFFKFSLGFYWLTLLPHSLVDNSLQKSYYDPLIKGELFQTLGRKVGSIVKNEDGGQAKSFY
jgi:hypothetical protein